MSKQWEEYIDRIQNGHPNPFGVFDDQVARRQPQPKIERLNRGLGTGNSCELPPRYVCRPNPPAPCQNCFNAWPEECYEEGYTCGARAAYSFFITNVIGEYDRRRNKTILESISGIAITYAGEGLTEPRCRNCQYPNLKHAWKVSNKADQHQTGYFNVGTNYECTSEECGDGRWTIFPDQPFEIDGPGCLVPDDTCSSDWDFKLEISFSWGTADNWQYMCPSSPNHPPTAGGQYVCDVKYYAGQNTPGAPYTGLAALDFTREYEWGPVNNLPHPKFNIALRDDTCIDEGCGTNWGSRPLFGGSPDTRAKVRFGFNTYSGYPACPC